jgi:hypothetical protein
MCCCDCCIECDKRDVVGSRIAWELTVHVPPTCLPIAGSRLTAPAGLPRGPVFQLYYILAHDRSSRMYTRHHHEILVDGNHEANGHKPLCLHGFIKSSSSSKNQRTRSNSSQTKRLCMHMQASKQMSRCHGDTALQQNDHASLLAYDGRPTNQQTFGNTSRQVLAVQPNTNRQGPRCLDNFPCNQTGAAEACAGPESCCGSAAPTARPRTLFSGC